MNKFLLVSSALTILIGSAHAAERRLDCVGLVTYYPVHTDDLGNPEYRNGQAALIPPEVREHGWTEHAKKQQDTDCAERLLGKNLAKVVKTCHQDKLCHVTGIMGSKGWVRIEKVEDYSEAD
jgi:hypothetical protein